MSVTHELVEKNIGLMAVLMALVVSVGGIVEIVPLMFSASTTQPLEGMQPYTPLALEGRDIYIREGCYGCHSQMIRSLRAETERYGPYSVAGESVWNHPFQWGSKRTGPDLARVGGRYSDEWHQVHLLDPRTLVPESNMPAYPWLASNVINAEKTATKVKAMQLLGVPYSDEDIANAKASVEGKTEMQALIAYLQSLGTARGQGKSQNSK